MRTTLVLTILLLSSAASADRYWDVPKEDAAFIAAKVEDQIVVEYCAGCGDIVTIYRVRDARVGKGDYSDGHQVTLKRELLLSGQSKLPLELKARCGTAAEHVDASEARLDIPYSYVLEGDLAIWVGLGTGQQDKLKSTPLTITAALQKAIATCAKRPPPPKVSLTATTIKVPRAIKGKERAVTVAGVRARWGNKSVTFPTFVAAKPKLASTFRARHGDAFVVELRPDGAPFGHVVLTPDPLGRYVAHIIAAPIERNQKGGFYYDPQLDRVRARAGRFVLVDDLNIRDEPKGKVLTRVHRGGYLALKGETDDWFNVEVLEGTEPVVGMTARMLVTDVAPLFDPIAKRWRSISHTEAQIVGLKTNTLDAMRRLADQSAKMKSADDLCAVIPQLTKITDPVHQATGDAWMTERGQNFDHIQAVFTRITRTLPGLDIRPTSEGVPVSLKYSALTRGQSRGTVDVLRAAEALEGTPFPIWMEQTWDLGGCTKVGRALLSVKLLNKSWSSAPTCLRKLLEAELKENIEVFGQRSCFCDSKKRVLKDVAKIEPHLKKLTSLGGDKAAKSQRAQLDKGTYSSECAN